MTHFEKTYIKTDAKFLPGGWSKKVATLLERTTNNCAINKLINLSHFMPNLMIYLLRHCPMQTDSHIRLSSAN